MARMSIEDGKDCRNWLNYPKEHMAIKEKRRMLKFQVMVFRRALKAERKRYDELLEGTERRKESYKPMFDTIDKLNDAYVIGQVDDQTYMSQRSRIWQVYSDRGHIANLEWLQAEYDKYKGQLDSLEGKMTELGKLSMKMQQKKQQMRISHNAQRRLKRRKSKAALRRLKFRELMDNYETTNPRNR